MSITNKRGIIPFLHNRDTPILELGCGKQKRFPDSVGVDRIDSDAADILCNLDEGLGFLPDESVGLIFNSSRCMQEFYEGNLSASIPAHELSFELEKA